MDNRHDLASRAPRMLRALFATVSLFLFASSQVYATGHDSPANPVGNAGPASQPSTVLIIDAGVEDPQVLQSGVASDVKVVTLRGNADGVEQVAAALQDYRNLASIQIISHGAPGKLALGSTVLTGANINRYQSELQSWGRALNAHGNIMLYGCNVAQGSDGDRFVNRIGQITGVPVAASADATGAATLGGNWLLEKRTGPIIAESAISARAAARYRHVLPLPANGVQGISSAWANNTPALGGFVAGFTFTNNSGFALTADPVNGGFFASNGLPDAVTTWTVNADGVNLASFDLTAASFPNVAGSFGVTADYSFTFTGYKVGGGTVNATGTMNFTPGATTMAWTTAPNFSAFTGITGFQVTFVPSPGQDPSNITFQNFTIANATAPVLVPTVTGINPASGSITGGTAVTITGTNFTGATSVTIGGVAATSVVVVNANTITAVTPAGGAGAQDVGVTTPGGTGTGAALYTYVTGPAVSAISPNFGPVAGGTAVTITGTNLTGATGVTIGGAAATSMVVVNVTTITAITPAGTAGAQNVVVTTPGGNATRTGLFTYVTAPVVTALSPNIGPLAGGTTVTITGTNFTAGATVTIGGVAATGVNVVNSTTITATTPAGTAGATNVTVSTVAGTGTGTGLFIYLAPPTVTGINPASGPTGGGTNVTITGTNFVTGARVTIGGAAATGVNVVNSTTIIATTQAGAAGAQDVVVTTTGGTATGTGLYTYVVAPTVTAITPNVGPLAGGTAVTVTGANFTGATGVTIGGVAATSVVVVNATTITAVTPAGAAGTRNVVVTAPGGTAFGPGLYTYAAVPAISNINPAFGPTGGGTNVTITGTNFTGATSVTIGGVAAASVNVSNSNTITAITPVGVAGVQDVVVTTPGGSATGTGLYTYVGGPTVTAITPNVGPLAGGTAVTITGTNLAGATGVMIGSVPATNVIVVNATTITAITPAGTAGVKNVVVATQGGTAIGAGLYTYTSAPTVTSISPASGTTGGGTAVTITGTGFTGATSVAIGGTAATSVVVVNTTTITAVTPAGTAGANNVVVTTPSGTATGAGLFTYTAPAPTANAAAMIVSLNTAATMDLSAFITGGIATGINISTPPAHGAVVVNGTKVTYTPVSNYSGADAFGYTATGAGGTSVPAVVAITVISRPDPTTDAAVTGLVTQQTDTARRFRDAQLFNFQSRLESRHHLPQGTQTLGSAEPTKGLALAGGAGNGFLPSNAPASRGRSHGPAQIANSGSGAGTGNGQNSEAPGAVGSAWLANTLVSAVTTSSVNLNLGALSKAAFSDDGPLVDDGDLEIWGAGNLRFGTRNQPVGGAGVDFTTTGATLGVDRRFDDQLTLGLGVGYARDKSTIGTDGTSSRATGNSVAAYVSYQATETMFVDALIGYGALNFDTTRFVAAANGFALANRTGTQTWGSIASGYEYRDQGLLLSPYARYNVGLDKLNAATETGAGIFALNYASQSTKSQQLSLGFRAEGQRTIEDVGQLMPRARIEYQHRIEGASQVLLAYADTIGTPYNLAMPSANTNSWLLGLGSGMAMLNNWSLDFEYQRQHATGQENIQAVNFRVSKRF